MSSRYGAPWSGLLKGVTIFASVLLLGLPLYPLVRFFPPPLLVWLGLVTLPAGIWLGALLFTIRGYEIASGELLIHRLLWPTRIPLDGLRRVDFDPAAVQGSIRTFGNGGLFSFSGWFWNRRLGRYRSYLTNHRTVVLLEWPDHKIAVSPDRAEAFVGALASRL